MNILEGQLLRKRFGDHDVLRDTSISITRGSSTAIAGATGSGKSTLIKILAGLIEPDTGRVLFNGQIVEGPLTKLIPGHEKIAYLSQFFELRNNYRVEEIFDYSNRLNDSQAEEIFKLCQVDHLLQRRTDQISGGERQRIALARVLLTNPDVLLLDEPFSNLDLIQKTSLKNVLGAVISAFQLTTVLVSHDPGDILPFADIVHVMKDGQIVQSGSPQDIYMRPQSPYVAGLFGHFTKVDQPLRELFASRGQALPEDLDFLRPEMLSITSASGGLFRGVVESTSFAGAFWQAKVRVNEYLLTCNYTDSSLQKGSNVNIVMSYPTFGK